jgi:hypothetical protein|nr:MAG TPA: hypothetical protein [Caudoviricetes sp.]
MKKGNLPTQEYELITMLKRELQAYYDNASKGGANRRKNMILLRWDIRKSERANKKGNNNK